MAAAQLQALLAATAVFMLTVLVLALFVLGARRLLAPGGEATVTINGQRRLTGALGIGIVPSTALVGGDGTVLYLRQGSLDGVALDSLVSALEALQGPSSLEERTER